jgi:hypothetical protein
MADAIWRAGVRLWAMAETLSPVGHAFPPLEFRGPGGDTWTLRPLDDGDAAALPGLRPAGISPVCLGPELRRPGEGCSHCAELREAERFGVVIVEPGGQIAAAAWLDPLREDPFAARLAFAVGQRFQGEGLSRPLLAALAREARLRRFERLHACVQYGAQHALDDFREGGLRITSCIGLGGITEVVLAVP